VAARRIPRWLTPGYFIAWLLFLLLAVISIYPLVWLVLNSFKATDEIFDASWLLPQEWHFENYAVAWHFGMPRYARAWVYLLVLGGSILPPAVSLFPLFRILTELHLYDTFAAMILPNVAFGLPFVTFLIRAYLVTVPYELQEAARIDGAGVLQAFWYIYIPLCRPILASTALIEAMRVWNEFIFGLTFVSSEKLKPLTVGIASLQAAVTTNWSMLMAGLVISILPILLCFLLMQRQFLGGLTQGAVK